MFLFALLYPVAALAAMLTGLDATGTGLPLTDEAAVDMAYDSIVNGKGWAGAGTIVAALVFFLKKYDVRIPKIGPALDRFLDQPVVSFALPLVVSLVGAFGTAIAHSQSTGTPFGDAALPALWGALKVTGAATFQFLLVKNAAEQKAKAHEAGVAAATVASASKAAAIDELKKP